MDPGTLHSGGLSLTGEGWHVAEQGWPWARCGSGERVRGQGRGRRTRCGWSVPPGGPVRLRELVGSEEKDGVRALDTRTKPRPGGLRVRAHGAWTNPPLTCSLLWVGHVRPRGVADTRARPPQMGVSEAHAQGCDHRESRTAGLLSPQEQGRRGGRVPCAPGR